MEVKPVTDLGRVNFDPFPSKSSKKRSSLGDLPGRVHGELEKSWGYMKHPVKTTKQVLKGVKIGVPKGVNPTLLFRINRAIAGIGLLSIISLLVAFGTYPSDVKKAALTVRLSDGEGAIRAVLEQLIKSAAVMNDLSTFVVSLAALEAIPAIAFFAVIALPLAISLLAANVGMGVYNTVRQGMHLHQVSKLKTNADLKAYLKEKLEVTDEELKTVQKRKYGQKVFERLEDLNKDLDNKEVDLGQLKAKLAEIDKIEKKNRASTKLIQQLLKCVEKDDYVKELRDVLGKDKGLLVLKKETVLARQTDKKIVTYMKKLKPELDKYSADFMNEKVAKDGLADMKTLLRRKITLEVLGTVAKLAMLTALVASLVLPYMIPIVLPVVGGLQAVLSLGVHVYKNKFLGRGLIHEEYLNPPKPREVNWLNREESYPIGHFASAR